MCNYQGYEFGAGRYPDSVCIDGRLFDADNCDSKGNLYEPMEEIPCPMCNEAGAIEYWTQQHMSSQGWPRKHARVIAKGLVKSIRDNRANGTEPWKQQAVAGYSSLLIAGR